MALKDSVRDHLVAFIGEFVGTFLFLFFSFAGASTVSFTTDPAQVNIGADPSKLLYISLVFGFSLAINVWIFFRVSGGLFNPAVTLALYLVGVVPPVRAGIVAAAQFAGAMAASIIVKVILPGNKVLFETRLAPGVTVAQGFFIEMFITFELVFTILMLAAEKTRATFVAPVGIGLAFFVDELVGVFWTGGSANPARSFGPGVAALSFPGYHWIYWFGPVLGAVVAAAFYRLLKTLRYENVNGNQDRSADEEMLIDAQTDRIENALKKWSSQISLNSSNLPTELPSQPESTAARPGSRIWSMIKPLKQSQESREGLKMYRMSESGIGLGRIGEGEVNIDPRRNTVAGRMGLGAF